MTGGGESEGTRSVLYCVVPRDLAGRLHDALREHFRDRADLEVVVERRNGERRARAPRRASRAPRDPPARERRRIRSASGRRVAERRAITVAAAVPPLPRGARRYAGRLLFVERLEPAPQHLQDADSKRLVIRYQAGDASAFEALYLRYFDAVYSYARVALEHHHEAEDVTQQAFTHALSALDRYEVRQGTPVRGWLFTIARNLIVDALRREGRMSFESPEQLSELKSWEPAAKDATVVGWLTDREIAMFVERLPPAQRQVLVLRFMLDLSGEETAAVLGRSHAAVRQLQKRALASLEQRLVAVGRSSARRGRTPMRLRMKPLPVVVGRRFVL